LSVHLDNPDNKAGQKDAIFGRWLITCFGEVLA
jgi:hypothetical protein